MVIRGELEYDHLKYENTFASILRAFLIDKLHRLHGEFCQLSAVSYATRQNIVYII